MMRNFETESLSHDSIHGYIPFISRVGLPDDEVAESEIIDHPWVQRLRQIHQLQTALWVFPTAEHTRFQHVLGVMHLASQAIDAWYDSLANVSRDVPSKAYVESLVRMAGLLHDVGHGPFSHFFDDEYLDEFDITHEDLGAHIIEYELGELLSGIRRNPSGMLESDERLNPAQIGWLIRRPKRGGRENASSEEDQPGWLYKLRSLFSGVYTVDNMDFVLRDAYASGYNQRAFDLSRLLHYSFFTEAGLTIHTRGLSALVSFIEVRANLFKTIYFHRTVRAMDLTMREFFAETMQHLFPGNPLEHLEDYRRLTEFSLLTDVARWSSSDDTARQDLGRRWEALLRRDLEWTMACQRITNFHLGLSERSTILSEPDVVERRLRERLPREIRKVPLRLDIARHYHRPASMKQSSRQNFLLDPAEGQPRELDDDKAFRSLPTSFSVLRVYVRDHRHDRELNLALDDVMGDVGDAKTNM